jgi:hypothetical protein
VQARLPQTLALAAVILLASPLTAGAQEVRSGGDGLVYLATYEPSLYVLDEKDLSVAGKIPMTSGVPSTIEALSPDHTRAYLLTIDYETIEVVDLPRRETVDVFTLSEPGTRARIRSIAVHPDGRHAVLLFRRYTKLRDRWDIADPELVLYDLTDHRIVRNVPWPEGEPTDNLSYSFSPDGSQLYFFMDDVRIYDTGSYTQVDRWDFSGVLGAGLDDPDISFDWTYRDEPGWHTGLFTVRDPIQDRELLGVARANPTLRIVEPAIIGPRDTGPRSRVSFSISSDGTRAYGLHQELERYQIWAFDLEANRARHVDFDGRPRMELEVSSNGDLLYVYNAGNTIDVFDAETLERLRTVELDADMIRPMLVLPAPASEDRH